MFLNPTAKCSFDIPNIKTYLQHETPRISELGKPFIYDRNRQTYT